MNAIKWNIKILYSNNNIKITIHIISNMLLDFASTSFANSW